MYGFLEQACAASGCITFPRIFKCAWSRGVCFCSHHPTPYIFQLTYLMVHGTLSLFVFTSFWRLCLVFDVCVCYSPPLGVTDVRTAGTTPPAGNAHFRMEHSGLGVWLLHGPHVDYHGQLTSISGSH